MRLNSLELDAVKQMCRASIEQPNRAIDRDTVRSPLRAAHGARHRGR